MPAPGLQLDAVDGPQGVPAPRRRRSSTATAGSTSTRGVARVPIDEGEGAAPEDRGCPCVRSSPTRLEGTHVAAGGESNGGRTIPGGRRRQVVAGSRRRRPRLRRRATRPQRRTRRQARGRAVISEGSGHGRFTNRLPGAAARWRCSCQPARSRSTPRARAIRRRRMPEAGRARQGRDRPEDRAAAAARPGVPRRRRQGREARPVLRLAPGRARARVLRVPDAVHAGAQRHDRRR